MESTEPTATRMAIQHALVARGSTVLAEFGVASNPEKAIAHKILDAIPAATEDGDTHFSYAHDRYVYCVKRSNDLGGLIVLCVAEDTVGRMIPYAFLQDIHEKILKEYGKRDVVTEDEFVTVLREQMDYYSNNPNADRMHRLQGQLDEVRHVILETIEKAVERGNKLEVLVRKTQCIRDQNFRFEKQARRKSRGWWSTFTR